MKHVLKNDMVAHVWAQQNQDNGRNSTGSFFFDGPIIYSYGMHFPIAEFLNDHTVITTSLDYSITTAKHKSLVARALSNDVTILEAPYIAGRVNHRANVWYFKDRIERFKSKAKRSLKYFHYSFEAMVNNAQMGRDYCSHFKLTSTFEHPGIDDPMFVNAKLRADEREQREREKYEKQKKKDIINFRKDIKLWKNKTSFLSHHPANAYNFPVMLRIKDGEIQSSHGASIPLDKAVKHLWVNVKRLKHLKRDFTPNGTKLKLGHFTVDHIDKRGNIKVGCHTIGYGELKSLARQLHYI